MFSFLLLYLCACSLSNAASVSGRYLSSSSRARCPVPEVIPNGSYRLKRNNNVMRITCRSGYFLQGSRLIDCVHGKWYGEKPVCAKKGCTIKPPNPTNGLVQIENELRAILFCNGNYKLAGNRYTYCNGSAWDRHIGSCRENKNAIEYECDFETEDLCGWAYEAQTATGRLEWRRIMAANMFTSFLTGPRHDHTHLHQAHGGHYMLMESLGSNGDEKISLMSPIYSQALSLKTACCFRFYYFMYGASVGTLNVFVRPVTISLEDMLLLEEIYIKFSKDGSQNNLWNEAIFDIEEMDSDFQIVFVASSGKTHLSDIAIDDVKLMTGSECKSELSSTDSYSLAIDDMDTTTTTESALYDIQSCVSRCYEKTPTGFGIIHKNDKLFGLCDCHFLCEESDSCCPDYRTVCLDFVDETASVTFNENIINEELSTTITAPVYKANTETNEFSTTTTTKKKSPVNRIKIITTPDTTTKATTSTTTATTSTTTSTTPPATPSTTTSTTVKASPPPPTNTTTVKSAQPTIKTTKTTTTTEKYTTQKTKVTSLSSLSTSATTTNTTTTRAQTTKFIAAGNNDEKSQKKYQQISTSTHPIKTLSPVKKIRNKVLSEQKHSRKHQHHGANVLLILFIVLGTVILLGTTWMRCKYRVKNFLQFRGQPKDTELLPNAHTSSAVLAAKFNPTTRTEPIDFIGNCVSNISENSSASTTNNGNPSRTNLANKRDTTTRKITNKVRKDQAPLLWEDENASENEDNYAGTTTALQQKHSTHL